MKFKRSIVEGYFYTYKQNKEWIKLISYVDDACYYCNSNKTGHEFENKLNKRFSLTLLGETKWCLEMQITQDENYITLDHYQ